MDLRRKVRNLWVRKSIGEKFIPEGQIEMLLQEKEVKAAISSCGFDAIQIQELSTAILRGGKKTFAILVVIEEEALIAQFVEQHQPDYIGLDAKLPFHRNWLYSILGAEAASEFAELQWRFIAPVFSRLEGHRTFDDNTIFPYVEESSSGFFGDTYVTKIHPDHFPQYQGLSKGITTVLRKESEKDEMDNSNEQRVLKHLSRLSHPNILELLASYTYHGRSNLIFPYVHQDLGDFLKQTSQPEFFLSYHYYFHALAGLASALGKFHKYRSGELQVEFSGAHGNLGHYSILVQQDRFMLAGFEAFGLCNGASFNSRYNGYYSAPEENDFAPGRLTSASDIWSFGCICGDLVTYMAKGAIGVAEFATMREVELGPLSTRTFHCFSNENPGVRRWLDLLAQDADSPTAQLISAVRGMLSIDPRNRPTAEIITLELRELTLLSLLHSIDNLYETLLTDSSSAELAFERGRYQLWCWTAGLRDLDGDKNEFAQEYFRDYDTFEQVYEVVSGINSEMTQLRSIVTRFGKSRPIYEYLHLKILNDRLCKMLPGSLLVLLDSRLELGINKPITEAQAPGTPDDPTKADATFSVGQAIQPRRQQLCAQCAVLDLDSLLNLPGKPQSYLRLVEKTWPIAKSSIALCTFCNLLADLVPPELHESLELQLRIHASIRFPEMVTNRAGLNLLCWDDGGPFLVTQSQDEWPIRRLSSNTIDYSIILGWLQYCQTMHGETCGARMGSSFSFLKLVDCNTRSIVPALNHQYLTLSYMWGPSQSDRGEGAFSDTLPANLPNTIEDAILVTKKLGFRYIWIDRYCIDQSNKEEAQKQLSQMNVIYQNSIITIIAAIGEDPSYGLPGVGIRERTVQPCANIGKHVLVSTLDDPRTCIKKSTWMTRGWTYQEALLSTRRLIFTD